MNTLSPDRHMTLQVRGRLLDLTRQPVVMGILNHTPDSFYAGSRIRTDRQIHDRIEQILDEGAEMIDVGGYSSRPDAADVSPEEEWRRLREVLTAIREVHSDAIVSVDTFRAEVARKCIEEGDADIINDVSGGIIDGDMLRTVAELQVPYILMHMRGTPKTMQSLCQYEGRVADDVLDEMMKQLKKVKELGLRDENIILDPGYGFSKTTDQNYELMADLGKFVPLGYPVLVGISRKSMLYRLLGGTPQEMLNGTTVLNTYALLEGAHIIRVHDVREAVEAVKIVQKIRSFDQDNRPKTNDPLYH